MSALDTIIELDISLEATSVPQTSFSIPMIYGTTPWSDVEKQYVDPSDLLSDGFITTDPVYVYAEEMFEQAVTPTEFIVGKKGQGSNTIAEDIAAIILANNNWYGAVMCSNTDADVEALAAVIEPLKKICLVSSNDSAIAGSGSSDVLSTLKGLGYNRTGLIYSPGSYNLGIDAAWMGGQLTQTPGSNSWAFQNLAGIAADALNDTQRLNIIGNPVGNIPGKNGNVYTVLGGIAAMQMGQMVSGRYIDITIGVDWLDATIQTAVYQAIITAAQSGSKIPYTDKGVDILMQAVEAVLAQGVKNGLINGAAPITISAPLVATVPLSQRAGRIAPPISFGCTLAGEIQSAIVKGTVSV